MKERLERKILLKAQSGGLFPILKLNITPKCANFCLVLSETHGVRLVILGEGEASSDVLAQERVLGVLDILDKGSVDGLLEGGTLSIDSLLLGTLGKESLRIGLLGLVVTSEESILNLGDINASNVDLGAGGESVDLVDALKRHTVDLVGATDEQETRLELLEADNSLATETTGEEDEDTAGLDTLAKLGGGSFLGSDTSFDILSRVPLELFDH